MPKKVEQWRALTLAADNVVIVLSAFFCCILAGCQEAHDFEKYALDAAEAAGRQEQAAKSLGVDKEVEIRISDTISLPVILIPSGTFVMGSPETEKNRGAEEFPHVVTISRAFYMGVTEVTQAQWEAVVDTRPWDGLRFAKSGSDHAATYVSWEGAVVFCRKLSAMSGLVVRLPTEAEWEYACRAGTITAFHCGNEQVCSYGWIDDNASLAGESYAHEVRLKKPNAWGLYDMHGNVAEWCYDWRAPREHNYYRVSPRTDPVGPGLRPPSDMYRIHVNRGGDWGDPEFNCRSAARGGGSRGKSTIGFRIVVEVDK